MQYMNELQIAFQCLFFFISKGIIRRDEMVFRLARERKIPIFMVLSGGYQPQTAHVIADSVLNLKGQGLIAREPNL
ncbi:HDAC11 [Bugula neritina]|uniref:HDAC11 n=1 Tax=Bugula neritina TaxID=10212 RepID=A0A7J7KQA0_BUGNE|nr:HDAC11 [Bugula neritina]